MLEINCNKCGNLTTDMGGTCECKVYGPDCETATKACAADLFMNYSPNHKKATPMANPNFVALLALMNANPHLPVVAMVDSEIVADDGYARWLGAWGIAEVDTYYKGEERVYFYDEDDMEDLLSTEKGWDWYENATDEELLETYRGLPWIECIVVNIDLPEV